MLYMLLKKIHFNNTTNLYEAEEAGIIYHIDPTLLDSLNTYFTGNPYLLFSIWYRNLDQKEQEKVKQQKQFEFQL